MSIWRLLGQVFRGAPVIWNAPHLSADALCRRCGRPASEQWCPSVCALSGEAIEWLTLCTECDIELNEYTVRFLR